MGLEDSINKSARLLWFNNGRVALRWPLGIYGVVMGGGADPSGRSGVRPLAC